MTHGALYLRHRICTPRRGGRNHVPDLDAPLLEGGRVLAAGSADRQTRAPSYARAADRAQGCGRSGPDTIPAHFEGEGRPRIHRASRAVPLALDREAPDYACPFDDSPDAFASLRDRARQSDRPDRSPAGHRKRGNWRPRRPRNRLLFLFVRTVFECPGGMRNAGPACEDRVQARYRREAREAHLHRVQGSRPDERADAKRHVRFLARLR